MQAKEGTVQFTQFASMSIFFNQFTEILPKILCDYHQKMFSFSTKYYLPINLFALEKNIYL